MEKEKRKPESLALGFLVDKRLYFCEDDLKQAKKSHKGAAMNGGVDLLKLCQEIEAKRDKILSQLSPNDKEKAKYILSIFDAVHDGDYAFVHSMFAGWAVFLFLFMPKLLAGEIGIGISFALLIPIVSGVIVHKALNHFYYEKKANRLAKELDEKMTDDPELRQIFWKIRREGHYSDFKIANKIWKKISK